MIIYACKYFSFYALPLIHIITSIRLVFLIPIKASFHSFISSHSHNVFGTVIQDASFNLYFVTIKMMIFEAQTRLMKVLV